ncbi:MAG: PAS domain-containing protein, partial [Candidatus Marinimicrobia bacterium]|nr:PAS domain-containing protein [Candidatus Neomarinimicrobiota bacterium]
MKPADKDQSQLLAYAEDLATVYNSEKQRRAQLETENKKLRATIDGIADGVVALDADKVVTEANDIFLKLIGIPMDQLLGQQLIEVLPTGAWRELFSGLDWNDRSDEIVIDLEKDRQHFFRVARTPLIDSGDTLQGWVITLHDETERKRTEGLKDEFLALVSHEIRTPMNAIMGFSTILESKLKDSLSEEEQKYFGLIKTGTERLLNAV